MSQESTKYRSFKGTLCTKHNESYLYLSGLAVFGQDAAYFVPLKDSMAELSNSFGPIGFLFQWWKSRVTELSIDHPLVRRIVDLPNQTTTDPEWPVELHRGIIFVIPKKMLETGGYREGSVVLNTSTDEFAITGTLFSGKTARNVADAFGWLTSDNTTSQ
ncbi:MAG: hypothetical protein R3C01_11315 [Planctomycetaceae bacterium]